MISSSTALLGMVLFFSGIVFMAVNTVIQRWLFSRTKISVLQSAFLEHIFAAPLLLLAWSANFTAAPAATSSTLFWAGLSTTILAGIVIQYSLAKSLSLGHASRLAPYEALTLLFVSFAAAGLLGEYPTPHGLFGLLLIVSGLVFQWVTERARDELLPDSKVKVKQGVRWAVLASLFMVFGLFR